MTGKRVVHLQVATADRQQIITDPMFLTYDELIAERRRQTQLHPDRYVDIDQCQSVVDDIRRRLHG